ncbi:MAG: hypothetical protein Fur005_22360 [Roseiflexaceae bacterium]|jgi:hypothetical protein
MNSLKLMMESIRDGLQSITSIAAVLGLFGWGIARMLTPLLPDWAQNMRGYFQNAMLTIIVMGGATTIVNALMGVIR